MQQLPNELLLKTIYWLMLGLPGIIMDTFLRIILNAESCTRIVGKGRLWVRRIVPTNILYFSVQNVAWFQKGGGGWWMFCTYKQTR